MKVREDKRSSGSEVAIFLRLFRQNVLFHREASAAEKQESCSSDKTKAFCEGLGAAGQKPLFTGFASRLGSGRRNSLFFAGILLTIYLALNLFLAVAHEPWRDEAQAWLIAGNLSPIGIIRQMRFEGHPCLWHFLLFPFARLGFPYKTMKLLSCMVMGAAAAIFLWKAPFSRLVKGICLFSSAFVYFYPVISRSYCLVVLFLVMTAAAYQKKESNPVRYGFCIALLIQTHVLMLGFAGTLVLLFWGEAFLLQWKKYTKEDKKRLLAGFFLVAFSVLLFALQTMGSLQSNAVVNIDRKPPKLLLLDFIRSTKLFLVFSLGHLFPKWGYAVIVSGIVLVLLLLLCYYRRQAWMLLGGIGFQIAVYTFLYGAVSEQKALLAVEILLFAVWTAQYEKKEQRAAAVAGRYILPGVLCLVLAVAFPWLVHSVKREYREPFSTAQLAAEFVHAELPEDAVLIPSSQYMAVSLAPYLTTQKIWSPVTEEEMTYITWDEASEQPIIYPEVLANIRYRFGEEGRLYLLDCPDSFIPDLDQFKQTEWLELMFTAPKAIVPDETFSIYEIHNRYW